MSYIQIPALESFRSRQLARRDTSAILLERKLACSLPPTSSCLASLDLAPSALLRRAPTHLSPARRITMVAKRAHSPDIPTPTSTSSSLLLSAGPPPKRRTKSTTAQGSSSAEQPEEKRLAQFKKRESLLTCSNSTADLPHLLQSVPRSVWCERVSKLMGC